MDLLTCQIRSGRNKMYVFLPVGSDLLLSAVATVEKKLHHHKQPSELETDQRHLQVRSHRFLSQISC